MSFLTALRRYPVGDADPAENFITEAWAWILGDNPELQSAFVRWVFKLDPKVDLTDLECKTQQNYDGFIDLLIQSDTHSFIFEHKLDALFQDNQPNRYFTEVKKRHKKHEVLVAVVSRTNYRPADQTIHSLKTWSEISQWLTDYLTQTDTKEVQKFLILQFIDLLKSKGMGPVEPINMQALQLYYQVSGLETQIKDIFNQLRDQVSWAPIMKDIPRSEVNKNHIPRTIKNRWGRIGIEFSHPNEWDPGLFFGVILDPTDHGFKADPVKGPELYFNIQMGQKHHKTYLELQKYEELKIKLKDWCSADNGWEFYDHLADKTGRTNKWHPLYLRKPLTGVIGTASTVGYQVELLKKELLTLMKAVVGIEKDLPEIPEFLELRNELKAK